MHAARCRRRPRDDRRDRQTDQRDGRDGRATMVYGRRLQPNRTVLVVVEDSSRLGAVW